MQNLSDQIVGLARLKLARFTGVDMKAGARSRTPKGLGASVIVRDHRSLSFFHGLDCESSPCFILLAAHNSQLATKLCYIKAGRQSGLDVPLYDCLWGGYGL